MNHVYYTSQVKPSSHLSHVLSPPVVIDNKKTRAKKETLQTRVNVVVVVVVTVYYASVLLSLDARANEAISRVACDAVVMICNHIWTTERERDPGTRRGFQESRRPPQGVRRRGGSRRRG